MLNPMQPANAISIRASVVRSRPSVSELHVRVLRRAGGQKPSHDREPVPHRTAVAYGRRASRFAAGRGPVGATVGAFGGEVTGAVIDVLTSWLQVLLFSSAVIGAAEGDSASMWVVVLASAVVIVLLCAVDSPRSVRASLVRPRGAIDVSVAVAQSDPDAAGHSRSRAPDIAALAA